LHRGSPKGGDGAVKEKINTATFIAAGKMTGSNHKEAKIMAVRHACFMMKATHINCRKPTKPEKAPQDDTAIVDGEVA